MYDGAVIAGRRPGSYAPSSSAAASAAPLEQQRLVVGGKTGPKWCGRPRKQAVVIVAVTVAIVVVVAVVAGVLAATLGGGDSGDDSDCAVTCTAFASDAVVVWEEAGAQPSFLRFSQDAAERAACQAPRALVVGGIFTDGWFAQWTLAAGGGAVEASRALVPATSGLLNWPHSVSQDPCSGTAFVANPQYELGRVDRMLCTATADGDTSPAAPADGRACAAFAPLELLTRDFYNPLGLHVIFNPESSSSLSSSSSGDASEAAPNPCAAEDSGSGNSSMFVTGGLAPENSYVGKYTRAGARQYLVPPGLGLLNKVYSPTVMFNGSLLVADSFNDRVARVDCADVDGQPVACVDDTAASGAVTTVLDTFYPRAVHVWSPAMMAAGASSNAGELAFVAGGNASSSTTYVKRLVLATGEVTTLLPGGTLNNPHCITVNPGTLDVVVCDKGNDRVLRIACTDTSTAVE